MFSNVIIELIRIYFLINKGYIDKDMKDVYFKVIDRNISILLIRIKS
jgi:hypothetical protein